MLNAANTANAVQLREYISSHGYVQSSVVIGVGVALGLSLLLMLIMLVITSHLLLKSQRKLRSTVPEVQQYCTNYAPIEAASDAKYEMGDSVVSRLPQRD